MYHEVTSSTALGRNKALEIIGTSFKLCSSEALQNKFVDGIISPDKEDCLYVGIKFLQPWLQQNYAGSIRAIKLAIAATEISSSAEDADKIATFQFSRRWASLDNTSALKDRVKS